MKNIKKFSPTVFVNDPSASSEFYIKHFGAKIKFDCGWYIIVSIDDCELCFMKPQDSTQSVFSGEGLMYSFEIDDVDSEFNRLSDSGLKVTIPLQDYPWGDRAFAITDLNGIVLYFYKLVEPTEEFKDAHKNS